MCYYIYTSKLHNRSITLSDFFKNLNTKYNIGKLTQRVGWGLGSEIFISNGGQQKSNWQTTLSMWLKKQALGPRPQQCVRKHFPLISFLSQWKIQCITKINAIWNSEQCSSELKCLRRKGVNIFALGGLLVSLNSRLVSLLSLQDTLVLSWSLPEERGHLRHFAFTLFHRRSWEEGIVVSKPVLSVFHWPFYVFLKRYFFTMTWLLNYSSMWRTEML